MYIGKTINLKQRLCGHYKERKSNINKIKWIKELRNNLLKPIIEIIDEVDENDWEFWEKYWIEQFINWGFNLLNISKGGNGISMIGGLKHSDETKKKISESGKGRIHSDETRKIMSLSRIGIVFSNEHIKNLSLSHKGKVNFNVFKPVIQIDCLNGNIINEFKSIRDAELKTGIYNEVISKCCKRKCKRAGGYYWCYKNEFENFKFKPFEKDFVLPKTSKEVLQIDINTNIVINKYRSIRDASISIGKGLNGRSSISKSMEKSGKAYGYKWSYVEQ